MKRYNNFPANRVRAACDVAYEPKTRDDLVVNKNRVNVVSDWLDSAIRASTASLLLLTGPAGCGKTATIRVLAAEKGIQVVDWITPADTFECWGDSEFLKPVDVISRFSNFLLGVGRYSSVIIDKSKITTRKLIVIKDYPLPLLSAPDEFRNIIDLYVIRSTIPIVFICTESVNKKSQDVAYDLFNEGFKTKHNILQVSFSSVAVTLVVRVLKRVVQITKWGVTDDLIRQMAEESCGDIRKAVNNLKVISVGGKYRCVSNGRTKRNQEGKKSSTKSNKDTDNDVTGLFHAVGRVLYAKREAVNTQNDCSDSEGELVHKPLDIVRQYSHYAVPFISLAHSNYLDIFSSIHSVAEAAEHLSTADVIMAEWRDRELLTTMGFGVAVAGLMDTNKEPVRKWNPLKGSQWNEDIKIASKNHSHIQDLFSDYCAAKLDVYLEILPYITQMWYRKNSGGKLAKCKYGFLPHSTSDMLETVKKIKTNVFDYVPEEVEVVTDEQVDDVEYNISEDSE